MISSVSNASVAYSAYGNASRIAKPAPTNDLSATPAQATVCPTAYSMEERIESTYLYNQQGNAVFDPIIALRHQADQGDAESQYQFGLAFDSHLRNTFQSPEESYLRRAAEQNHPAAAREYANRVISTYYNNARGFFSVRPSFEDAEIFFRRAATNGDAQAAISYAELFSKPPILIAGENGSFTHNPILQRDAVRQLNDLQDALHCLRPYAEDGNASAQMEYAKLTFELARRVEESALPHKLQDPYLDVAEAVGFLGQAATQGMPQAQYDYAMLVVNTYQGENSLWPDSLPLPDYDQAEQYLQAAALEPLNSDARQAYTHMWLSLDPLRDRNGQPIPNPLAQRPAEEQLANKRLAMGYLYDQATRQRDTHAQYRYAYQVLVNNKTENINPRADGRDATTVRNEALGLLREAAEKGHPLARMDYGYELLRRAATMKLSREENSLERMLAAHEEAENYLAPANPPGN